MKDSKWIGELFCLGLVPGSFIPDKKIRMLRECTRCRCKMVAMNSFSKTDPDATFMRMKEDHMRNAQLKPGYNVQLGVEGEYITGTLVSSERNDQQTMIPLMENMRRQLGREYKDVTLDAGYDSEENHTYYEDKSTVCYIKPQNYERSKTRKYKNNMALRENMAYDAVLDEYLPGRKEASAGI